MRGPGQGRSGTPTRGRRPAVASGLAVAVALGVPVAAWASGTGGGPDGQPAGCVPGTVVRDGDARQCELVDDPAVPGPPGWASEADVSHLPGDAAGDPDPADGSWETATQAQEGDAAPGTRTGIDLAGLRRLGLTTDAAGLLTYRGTAVRGLVQRHDDDVVSVYWSDTGESYVLVDGDVVREVPEGEFPELGGS